MAETAGVDWSGNLSAIMLVVIVYAILGVNDQGTTVRQSVLKQWVLRCSGLTYGGGTGFYAAARRSGCGLPRRREERAGEVLSNRKDDSAKRKRRSTHDPLTTWTDPRGNLIVLGLTGLVIRRNLLFMLIGLKS